MKWEEMERNNGIFPNFSSIPLVTLYAAPFSSDTAHDLSHESWVKVWWEWRKNKKEKWGWWCAIVEGSNIAQGVQVSGRRERRTIWRVRAVHFIAWGIKVNLVCFVVSNLDQHECWKYVWGREREVCCRWDHLPHHDGTSSGIASGYKNFQSKKEREW